MNTSYPTVSQELLLRAALLPDGDTAWHRWKQTHPLDSIGLTSQQLLPLVASNLSLTDDRIKGIHRYIWVKNSTRLHRFLPLLTPDIPHLFLKGVPLLFMAYNDLGLRDMNDIDILIPPDRMNDMKTRLEQHGWRAKFAKFRAIHTFTDTFLRLHRSITYVNAYGEECDIHWRVPIHERDLTPFLWERTQTHSYQNYTLVFPSPEALYTHVVLHGLDYNCVPTIRWIADAHTLITTYSLSWEVINGMATSISHGYAMSQIATYLNTTFQHAIPPPQIYGDEEVSEYMSIIQEKAPQSPQSALQILWSWHGIRSSSNPLRKVLSFPQFLRAFFGVKSLLIYSYSIYRNSLK